MKFENFYIECKTQAERELASNALLGVGYRLVQSNYADLTIGVYDCGTFQFLNKNAKYGETLKFSDFMSKYSNQFHDKIKKAMSDFGLGREELSRKLGYSDPYITKMLTLPQSEKVKKKVVEKIELLYVNQDIENDASIQVAAIQKENEQLKKELDHKNQVLDKRNDLFKDAEYEITCLNDTIKNMQIVLNERTDEVNGVKSAFEHVAKIDNERITELKNLNKQLGIDLSKRNKDVNLLNFGCVVLGLIILIMACFLVGG